MEKAKELLILKNNHILVGNIKNRTINETVYGYVQSETDTTANPSVKYEHNYIVYGSDITNQLAFICECGDAFLSKQLAVEHYNLWNPEQFTDDNFVKVHTEGSCNVENVLIQGESSKTSKKYKKVLTEERIRSTRVSRETLLAEAVYARHGYPTSVTYQELLSKKIGIENKIFRKRLRQSIIRTDVGLDVNIREMIDAATQEEANEIHFSILELMQKDPYASVRSLCTDELFSEKGKILLHAIFHFSGLKVTKLFLSEFAIKVGLPKLTAFNTWKSAVEIFLTNADHVYEKILTNQVMQEAGSLYDQVMRNNLMKNWGRSYAIDTEEWIPGPRFGNTKLLIESLFLTYGTNIHWLYLDAWAGKLQVTGNVMFKWWKEAVVRVMLSIDNPYSKYINEEVRNKAKEIHDSIPSCHKTDDDRPRTTNSIELIHVTDNHAAYPKEMGKRWMLILEEVYRMFGYQQSLFHFKAYAKLLGVTESYVYRHWHEIKTQGVLESKGDSQDLELHNEAKQIKEKADVEVAKILDYQCLSPGEMKEELMKAEWMMTEIFAKYGVIHDEFYIESCAAFLKLDTSEFYGIIEKVKNSMKQDSGAVMEMHIPSIQEKAFELHEQVMMCIKNAKEKTMII